MNYLVKLCQKRHGVVLNISVPVIPRLQVDCTFNPALPGEQLLNQELEMCLLKRQNSITQY